MDIKIGSMYYADLSPVTGSEVGGCRAVKVVAKRGDLVQIIPLAWNESVGNAEFDEFQRRAIDTSRIRHEIKGGYIKV